jgi:hypothetical protein
MTRLFATLIAFILAFAAPSRAAELEYAYPDQSVWTTRVSADGTPDNPLLRIAKTLFTEAGIAWHGVPYPATRMFENLKTGQSQFSMLVKAPALARCCLFGQIPVASTELRVYRHQLTPPIGSAAELAGKRVTLIQGYSYAGIRKALSDPASNTRIDNAPSHRSAFALLERGRTDYVLDYTGPSKEILTAHPIADVRHDTLSRLEVFLVLHKSYPDAEAVMARLDKIVARLDTKKLMAGN